MRVRKSIAMFMGVTAVAGGVVQAQTAPAATAVVAESPRQDDPFIRGLKAGKVIADVRVRYEAVDDSIRKDAEGLTVRTRLGYQTGLMGGFRLLGEFTDTRTLFGVSDFFPEQDASKDYAIIADPSNTEVNRAVVSYEGWEKVYLGLGRQRIILDNARWVGNVGWRQKEQTYDAGSIDVTFGPKWKLSYDYMDTVQGVVENLDRDVSNSILNTAFTGWDAGTLSFYGYWLEDDDSKDKNNTYGLRFHGATQPGRLKWLYTAEYANQEFDPDSGSSFNTNYYHLMGGIGVRSMTIKLGHEVLGSDGGDYALQTPLATKFKFNGWADMFLLTPKQGLRDTYLHFGSNWMKLKWAAIYHDFRADDGSDRYGSELDLHVSKSFGKYYLLGIKYAGYRADDAIEGRLSNEDRHKLWLWFDFKY